jgi:hypothetical protein
MIGCERAVPWWDPAFRKRLARPMDLAGLSNFNGRQTPPFDGSDQYIYPDEISEVQFFVHSIMEATSRATDCPIAV